MNIVWFTLLRRELMMLDAMSDYSLRYSSVESGSRFIKLDLGHVCMLYW